MRLDRNIGRIMIMICAWLLGGCILDSHPPDEVILLVTDEQGKIIGREKVEVCNEDLIDLDYSPASGPSEPTPSDNTLTSYDLRAPFPNPASTATTIIYQVPETTYIVLAIVDEDGDMVRRLVDGWQAPGMYSVAWDLRDQNDKLVRNKIYSVFLRAGDFFDRWALRVQK